MFCDLLGFSQISFQTLKLTNTHVISTFMLIAMYIQRELFIFWSFLAENILPINFKVLFPRWHVEHYEVLPVMNRSILMYYLTLTSCIQLKNQISKTLNVSSVMENSRRIEEGKFGLSVSAVHCECTWTVPQQ